MKLEWMSVARELKGVDSRDRAKVEVAHEQ